MIWPRWLAHLAAEILGYFWIPCPVCGQHFAGFEASSSPMVNYRVEGGELISEVTCSKSDCVAEASRQQKAFFDQARFARAGKIIHLKP